MWKQFLRNYLNFSLKDRTGVISIVIITLIFVLFPLFYPLFIKHKQYNYSDFAKEIDALNVKRNNSVKENQHAKNYGSNSDDDYSVNKERPFEMRVAEVFYFDPNTASAADWKRLGIRDKTIHTIQELHFKRREILQARRHKQNMGTISVRCAAFNPVR